MLCPGMLLRWARDPPGIMSNHYRFSRAGAPAAGLPTQAWDNLEQILQRFEEAWRRGERPVIEEYLRDHLTAAQAMGRALLVELAHAELELRLKAGEAARVEEYLQRFPELAADPSLLLELLNAEGALRRGQGEDVAPDEYLQRFPPHGAAIKVRLSALSQRATLSGLQAPMHAEGTTLPPRDEVVVSPTLTGPESPVAEALPVVSVPGYELLGVLGQGGMGVVYQARQLSLGRIVALKVLPNPEHAGPDALQRFEAEAKAVARLQHPHVVQVYEVGRQQGLPYFSMEYCEGGSLDNRLDGTPWQPDRAAALVEILARAVHAAHGAGVVHRDLKPGNVLLAADGMPKVTDFGLAKRLDVEGQTRTGAVMGTPCYMSPEQAGGRGKEVGPATDVYALGVILYELLTGRPPFKGATDYDTIMQVIADEPVPVRRLQPRVSRDLETVCHKCLEKDPARRYASAAALAEDLGRFLAREPILARPIGGTERLWRWCRRHPGLAALVAACPIVAWAVTISLWVSQARQKDENNRARQVADQQAAIARDNVHRAIEQEAIARDNARVATELHLQAATRMSNLGKDVFKILRARALRQHAGPEMRALSAQVGTLFEQMMCEMGKDLDSAGGNHFGLTDAYQRVSDLLVQQGLSAEALRNYQKGYELTRAIARQEPENDMARAHSAVFLLRLGNMEVLLRGDAHAAREYYRKAQALREEIAEHPRSGEYPALENKIGLSYCAWELGRAELELGHPAAARDHMQKAVDYRRAWVEARPKDEEARGRLAEMCMWLGIASWHVEDAPAVEASFGEACRIYAQLVAPYPNAHWFRADQALILGNRGEAFLRLGRPDEAEKSFAASLKDIRVSLAGDPEETSYSETLALTQDRLARLDELRGNRDSARSHDEEALRLWGELLEIEPSNLAWQAAHARSLAHCGKEAEAIARAEALLKKNPRSTSLQMETARCYAICAAQAASPQARQRYTARAIEALRAATVLGYKDWFALRTDPELAALRQQAEYQALFQATPPR